MLTNRLIHIHVFRTGGFVLRDILPQIEGIEVLDDRLHPPYKELARIAQERLGLVPPAVTFIRNPWAWYVSMWRYVCLYRKPPHRLTFAAYMDAIKRGHDDPDYVKLSDHWQTMGADGRQYLGRFEYLDADIVRCLGDIIPDLIEAEAIVELIAKAERFHPSEPWADGPIADYTPMYDDETRQLVQDWDGELIERLGYGF